MRATPLPLLLLLLGVLTTPAFASESSSSPPPPDPSPPPPDPMAPAAGDDGLGMRTIVIVAVSSGVTFLSLACLLWACVCHKPGTASGAR